MNFKTTDGLQIYYEISGNGDPCIFLHGGPGYWSKSFQVYAQDLLEEDLQMVYLESKRLWSFGTFFLTGLFFKSFNIRYRRVKNFIRY